MAHHADIVHPPETLTRLVSKALGDQRDLVTLMVHLRCESFWEHRLIPAFIFFFQMLYPPSPPPITTAPKSPPPGAACCCAARLYPEVSMPFRARIIDDRTLAAFIKACSGKNWLGLADASPTLLKDYGRSPWEDLLLPATSLCNTGPRPSTLLWPIGDSSAVIGMTGTITLYPTPGICQNFHRKKHIVG
jgi:hypothetical protein